MPTPPPPHIEAALINLDVLTAILNRVERARLTVAVEMDVHHYPPHHHERTGMDDAFDSIADALRALAEGDASMIAKLRQEAAKAEEASA